MTEEGSHEQISDSDYSTTFTIIIDELQIGMVSAFLFCLNGEY